MVKQRAETPWWRRAGVRPGDWALLVLLVLGSVALSWYMTARPVRGARRVVATVDKAVVFEATITPGMPSARKVIQGVGGSNTIICGVDGVAVVAADCPDGVCVSQGKISRPGQSIVCLPHHLVVRVQGAEEAEVDGIAR